ncbi:MAG: PTS mannose transporter subunit IIA [Moritella sp.]|uniref:PTS sugar transporter subunit IIA domain-containing protein n=1 Tax=Moritella sp. TaxID=78556 RepID=UPI001E0DB25F|nr:PTS mannose transporter subunit IIA [Moritella sp.]NQZ51560.1 PTS mannose transporter subunit IIA [Moritella sp.]
MIGIIVSGHACYALGMRSAVEALAGKPRGIRFIDFTASLTTDELQFKLVKAISEIDQGDGVLILTDLPGGTPCNRAVAEMVGDRNIKVISGANLSMIVDACQVRKGKSLVELTDAVVKVGRSAIKDMEQELNQLTRMESVITDEL